MATPYDQALVRRDGNTWKRNGGHPLCEVCGTQHNCDLREALGTLAGHRGAGVTVGPCASFVPVISFKDPTGIEGRFNTFRRGRGWANRLVVGQRVETFDLAGRALLGNAQVEVIRFGPLADMLIHAPMNHLMKAWPEQETPERLHTVLRRLYGNNYAAASEVFSVIGLSMEDG